MNFQDRIEKASKFEKELFKKIAELGFVVAINGTEHTYPAFIEGLKNSTDQTSLAIRFQPDGVARIGKIPRSFYVEAKASKSIERTAYDQYKKLFDAESVVVIVFEPLGWGWCFIEEMPLEDGHDTVATFPVSRRFPVSDDGWLYPRKSTRGIAKGSGTPYRKVESEKLREWYTFKKEILKRLDDNAV